MSPEQAERWAENIEEHLLDTTIPQSNSFVTPAVEQNIKSAAALIAAGAKPETVLRTMYLFGVMDGTLKTSGN